ncbi:MAG TPA: S41 family peptidase [Thermoanaerobaculia bacterium]|jgi:hypothetical protein
MLFLLLTLFAQQQPPDMPITPARRTQIVENAAKRIEEEYVDPEKGKEIAAALRTTSFTQLTALDFVRAVNAVLKTSGDKHLQFGYDASPSNDDDDTPAEKGAFVTRRLDGNIGLLTVKWFPPPASAGDDLMKAMKRLAPTKALIVDLRNSQGGSADMVNLMLSCFMPPDPVLVSTVYFRPTNSTRQFWTLPYLPIPRYVNKPVYILTSKRDFSGAEGFCEHMKRLRHAIVVGETTRGGAHMTRWEVVDPNFGVAVPVARHLEHDWEGVGITPDVAVPEADALATAVAMVSRR